MELKDLTKVIAKHITNEEALKEVLNAISEFSKVVKKETTKKKNDVLEHESIKYNKKVVYLVIKNKTKETEEVNGKSIINRLKNNFHQDMKKVQESFTNINKGETVNGLYASYSKKVDK